MGPLGWRHGFSEGRYCPLRGAGTAPALHRRHVRSGIMQAMALLVFTPLMLVMFAMPVMLAMMPPGFFMPIVTLLVGLALALG